MRAALRAYPTLLRVGLAEAVAYRAEMLVWMLTTTMPLVSLALWHAVAESGPIGRFGPRELTSYFLAGLIVRQVTSSWVVWEMNQEIRTGTLSLRLLRPIHPLLGYSAENLAALPIRGALSLPVALAMLFLGGSEGVSRFLDDPTLVPMLIAALVGAWLITFLLMCAIGALGFFMESSSSVFEVYLGLFFALSGYLFPLEFLAARAPWVMGATRALPFYYQLGFPIELMLGLLDRRAALRGLAIEWAYVAFFYLLATRLWRLGMRRFGAYGA
ncbi:MAG: ABC transporter permease [Myxococcales bacterium]|nr:ABC transporter permease [Myxococcales bacterium]